MITRRPFAGIYRATMHLCASALLAFTFSGCNKTPEGVLQQEDMAQLMADIHLGEAMIDFNYTTYPNDSTRKMLKQSIFAAHNVSAEQVDTSFVWYGNHIEEYIKVYDRTIEIIQERQRNTANAAHAQISVAGDSVQVWSGPQRLIVSTRMPSRIITFSLPPDSTWKKGDIYTLSYKLINSQSQVNSRILVDYAEGITGYSDETTTQHTTSLLQIQPDSTLTPVRIYGYMAFNPENNKAFEVDSILLTRVRKDLMPRIYLRQNMFAYTASDDNGDETETVVNNTSAATYTPRHNATSPKKRPEARITNDLPQSSSQLRRSSEHRDDAQQHKPTPAQRRDAARQRNATMRGKNTPTIQKMPNQPARQTKPQKTH